MSDFRFEAEPGPRSLSKVFVTLLIANMLLGLTVGIVYGATALLVTTGTVNADHGILTFGILMFVPTIVVGFWTFSRVRSLTRNGYSLEFVIAETLTINCRSRTLFSSPVETTEPTRFTITPTSKNGLNREAVGLQFKCDDFHIALACDKTDFGWVDTPTISEDVFWICSPSDFLRLVGILDLQSFGKS